MTQQSVSEWDGDSTHIQLSVAVLWLCDSDFSLVGSSPVELSKKCQRTLQLLHGTLFMRMGCVSPYHFSSQRFAADGVHEYDVVSVVYGTAYAGSLCLCSSETVSEAASKKAAKVNSLARLFGSSPTRASLSFNHHTGTRSFKFTRVAPNTSYPHSYPLYSIFFTPLLPRTVQCTSL